MGGKALGKLFDEGLFLGAIADCEKAEILIHKDLGSNVKYSQNITK